MSVTISTEGLLDISSAVQKNYAFGLSTLLTKSTGS